MTDKDVYEQTKAIILEAEKEAKESKSIFQEVARKIVQIERKYYYSDRQNRGRLIEIREVLSNSLKDYLKMGE